MDFQSMFNSAANKIALSEMKKTAYQTMDDFASTGADNEEVLALLLGTIQPQFQNTFHDLFTLWWRRWVAEHPAKGDEKK